MFERHPRDVGVILTYRCHGGCAHCLYNCGPRRPDEWMSVDVLRLALETVAGWPQVPQVHLTGGEPFLHPTLLLKGARIAADLSIPCYVETSGSWCVDEDDAIERFRALRRAGLQAVLISCSPFHAERIPPERTLRAIRAALETFGPHRVTVYRPEFLDVVAHFALERPTPLARYEETLGPAEARRILWEGYGIIGGGRAGYRLGRLAPRRPVGAFAGVDCVGELLYALHSHMDLHGNYVPAFCGGLAMGDWREMSRALGDVQAGRYPAPLDVLVERGPHGLFELARHGHGYRPLTDGYADKCHLCVDVRRWLAERGEWPALRPRGFYADLEWTDL